MDLQIPICRDEEQSLGKIKVLWVEFLQGIQKTYLKNAVGERPGLDKFRSPCLNQLDKEGKSSQRQKIRNKRTEPQQGVDPNPMKDKTKENLLHSHFTYSQLSSNSFSELFPNKFLCMLHHKNIFKKKSLGILYNL